MWFKKAIAYKKAALQDSLGAPMDQLAAGCVAVWPEPDALDGILQAGIASIPHCHLLYALNTDGIQISSNVSPIGIDISRRGQDVSGRPYHSANLPYRGLMISPAYLSEVSQKRCITAVQAVSDQGTLLGFIGADFNLDELPEIDATPAVDQDSTQYKGDPAIRSTVFMQSRMKSAMDGNIDQVMGVVEALFREHGAFHTILHFSSSRIVLWLYDDPYNYRLHGVDELLDPELWLAYPSRRYPTQAKVSPDQLHLVLEYFKVLREADENIYLRSASINIMNGVVGLTFSCDGSHYMQAREFLNKELSYWV